MPADGFVEDASNAVRVRARYMDPYEDWEREARKEAFVRALGLILYLVLTIPFMSFNHTTTTFHVLPTALCPPPTGRRSCAAASHACRCS
jgi:hypothetical protein